MDSPLSLLEERLKRFLESTADKVAGRQPLSQLAHELVKAMQLNLSVKEDGSFNAPRKYTVHIHPKTFENWNPTNDWVERLSSSLKAIALEDQISFQDSPSVKFLTDTTLPKDELRITVDDQDDSLEKTHSIPVRKKTARLLNEQAFLILGKSETFRLEKSVINIGRRSDNHLVITDPRVSRRHAQLRWSNGTFVICDLNSTGGTYVNGEKIGQKQLMEGDVISLSGFKMVYGSDSGLNSEQKNHNNISVSQPDEGQP